jgi:DNA-binding CsgD family transcriptional regulator
MKVLALKDLSVFDNINSKDMLQYFEEADLKVVRVKSKEELFSVLKERELLSPYMRSGVLITQEESKMMSLVKDGKSNKKISEELGVDGKEVRNVLLCLFRKIKVKKKSDAIRWFLGAKKNSQ